MNFQRVKRFWVLSRIQADRIQRKDAKTQRRKDGSGDFDLVRDAACARPRVPKKTGGQCLPSPCAFAPLRLCVKKFAASFSLSLLLLSLVTQGVAAAEDHFKAGLETGRAGNYAQAVEAFQKSLAEQSAAGTLLNLGIVEWRSGRTGQAILSWEQSAWLNPFDQDARNNLNFARLAAQLEPLELAWYETASTWLPANRWAWIACVSLWLAVAMMILPGVLRARKAGWQQTLAALGFCVFLLSLPPNLGVVMRSNLGILLEKKTVLRLTPTRESEVVSSLTAGESVRKIRARGNYFFVRTQHGSGWIEQKQLGLLSQP